MEEDNETLLILKTSNGRHLDITDETFRMYDSVENLLNNLKGGQNLNITLVEKENTP